MNKKYFLFIEPKGTSCYLHNGLAYLVGVLADKAKVEIIDLNYLNWPESKVFEYIKLAKPDFLGISAKSANQQKVSTLIKSFRIFYKGKIMVGGPHISLMGEEYLFEHEEIDFGLRYEAEKAIIDFLDFQNGQKKIEEISGLIYRKDGKIINNDYKFIIELDEINFPNFDHYVGIDIKKYFKQNAYPLLTSRGCPYNCIYCSVKNVSGSAWRPRSVESIIKELKEVKIKYEISEFEIVDDNFTMNQTRAIEFCQALMSYNLDLRWGCPNGLRADKISEKLARNMYSAGCRYVSIGIESGDEKVFNNINKGETLDDIVKAVKILMDNQIKVSGFFIVGLPYDNLVKTKKTIKFINNLQLNGGVKWNFLVPYPKTELWQWVRENAKILSDFSSAKHFSKNNEKIIPSFETDDFTARQRLRAWILANLSTSSYRYVFKVPRNKFFYKIKIFFYLLYYSPKILIKKFVKKIGL